MRTLLASAACFVLLATVASVDAAPAARPSQPPVLADIINMLESQGRISHTDAARVRREVIERGAGPKLAAEVLPGGARCLTQAMRQALPWLESQGVQVMRDPPVTTNQLTSTKYPIRVNYNTEDALAKETLAQLEASWKAQIEDGKFRVPWTGGDSVPLSQAIYAYISDLGANYSGMAEGIADVPSTPICDCSSRLILNTSLPTKSVAEVASHEMNHMLQFAADCTESYTSSENFAVAVQSLQNPASVYLTKMFLPEFQDYPDYPVDYASMTQTGTPSYYYQFGSALFPLFLAERYGEGKISLIAELWDAFVQDGTVKINGFGNTCSNPNKPNWFDGTDAVLKTKGSSFDEAFDEFSAWRSITGSFDDGKHFMGGSAFAEVAIAATHGLDALPIKADLDLHEYGSRHIVLEPKTYTGGIKVSVAGDPEAGWGGSLLLWKGTAPVERVVLKFNKEKGEATVDSLEGTTRAVLVVTQKNFENHSPDDQVYDVTRTFSYAVDGYTAPVEPGPEPQPDAASSDDSATLQDGPSTGQDAAAPAAEDSAGGGGCGCRIADRSPQGLFAVSLLALAIAWSRRRAKPGL
ncbi:MAG: hypothetical protein HY898_26725 [Deltaproteobacteria bacterium]|nr:hypothetical protein [Deltaproteobacteria bacterium]